MVSADLRIFSSKRSFLLRKRMIEVSPNHLLLQIESKSFKLSCIRFVVSSSCKTYAKENIMNWHKVVKDTYDVILHHPKIQARFCGRHFLSIFACSSLVRKMTFRGSYLPGHILTLQRRKWSPWHLRSNESTSFAPIADRRRRKA